MEDVAKRLFRYFLPVERETAQGEKTQGRGLIAADRGSGEALTEELFHQLGRLPRPLYWFTGWAQGLACGEVLRQGEETYRVLRGGGCDTGPASAVPAGAAGALGGGR